ncbi:hypothetical protein E2C01_026825 [Portunus trituberculatus]|uniref:Uncharacterized protein n=1 Tax=Portunus trituberculatus TaxID=210409 RepID=A0A5B7EM24_PORTR|nr:hypothetical protein [Portunus trituberculatus]
MQGRADLVCWVGVGESWKLGTHALDVEGSEEGGTIVSQWRKTRLFSNVHPKETERPRAATSPALRISRHLPFTKFSHPSMS